MKHLNCALRVFGHNVTVHSQDEASFGLLCESYSAFLQESNPDSKIDLRYRIDLSGDTDGWVIHCDGDVIDCRGTAAFLFEFEKDMTLRLQKLRTDLFFVHGAALSIDDRCVVISGESGSGKSTLAWSLCHQGFAYMSDELAPIHPTHMHVEPYPHALNLKTEPLTEPFLPKSTIRTSATMHVPAYELPEHAPEHPCLIGTMVFIDSCRNGRSLEINRIGSAEAAARLYANGLNQLAHIGDGLPAATRIARSVPAVFITGGTVEERSCAIKELL